jgi:DNA-directed RNA polymerase specialized sigma24 family protein
MRTKADVGYKPQWDGKVKEWARKYLYKHRWRCDSINEIEDLMQDAFLLYLKVVDYYPAVRRDCHFITLYQTTLRNYVTECSRQMRVRKGVLVDGEADASEYSNWGYVMAALAKTSDDLKKAMIEIKEVLS